MASEVDKRPADNRRRIGEELHAARRAARERYRLIAAALKAEAGIRRHYIHKEISGLAWSDRQRILAPAGITRRQLYVLAHECAHVVLHGRSETWDKPGHVKEHEAETYAHRAFQRYGLEVPPKSARWARDYVGEWIMKDRAAGIPICSMAEEFANGQRSPHDPLPALDASPQRDFSRKLERFTARGTRLAEKQELELIANEAFEDEAEAREETPFQMPPNACGTCVFISWRADSIGGHRCNAHKESTNLARSHAAYCNHGQSWRPKPSELRRARRQARLSRRSFWSRLGDAIIARIGGNRRR